MRHYRHARFERVEKLLALLQASSGGSVMPNFVAGLNTDAIDGTSGNPIQFQAPELTVMGSGVIVVTVSMWVTVTAGSPTHGVPISFAPIAFDLSSVLTVPIATVADNGGNLSAYFSTTFIDDPGFDVGDTVTYGVQATPSGAFTISVPQANLASVYAYEL